MALSFDFENDDVAHGRDNHVAPVYRWDHVGAPGRIILVSLLRGAALEILCRRSIPQPPLEILAHSVGVLTLLFGVVARA